MDNHRKLLGFTPHEFRSSSFYEELHLQAQEIAAEMMNSDIIQDFRSVSSRVLKEFNGDYIMGPTGLSYLV
jgi:hypothetical protein